MERFGRYRLLKRIAVGGMGEIFLARSASIDGFEKDLVIKRILPDLCADEKFVSLFIDEARISISLAHENVIQVFDFGQFNGAYYIAMEYVHGSDLIEVLSLPEVDLVGIDPGLALYITAQCCRGLEYAHNLKSRAGEPLNLIHRDISPDNVMVSFDGGVKLTDFGISKVEGSVKQEKEEGIVGKYPYMSPEHASGQATDQRSDIFSLAAVCWELLCGERLYEGDLTRALYDKICAGEVERPSKVNKKIPRAVDKVVMWALEKDPAKRPQTAREWGSGINEVLRTKYPQMDNYALGAYLLAKKASLPIASFDDLTEEDLRDNTPVPVVTGTPDLMRTSVTVAAPPPVFGVDETLLAAADAFRKKPSAWQLVRIGHTCAKLSDSASAVSAYRMAAVKFAQHGLLAQSLMCAKGMLGHGADSVSHEELALYPSLAGKPDQLILPYMFRRGGPVEELLATLITENLGQGERQAELSPLLSLLSGDEFASLAQLAPMKQYKAEQAIVRQRDSGNTMFLILSGRVVVYAENDAGERIYLASLTAGDFFGENSFFTGAPRSATVEASEAVAVMEIDRELYDQVMKDNPEASDILLSFYKDRVVEAVLATSPAFGLLEVKQRKALADKFQVKCFRSGEEIIRQGDTSGEIYLVKMGRAQAFIDDDNGRKQLAEIGPGTLLGEMAAIMRSPRTATVVAGDNFEALELPAVEFQNVLDESPELRQRIQDLASKRMSSFPRNPLARSETLKG